MTSLMTNTAAIAALDTLRSITSSMNETQKRVSSGYKVETASDNAAYWSIATTMRSDNMALAAVEDALGFGAAKTDTAYTGLEAAVEVVTEIKAKLVAAREPGVDKEKINKELTELKAQLSSISESASFSGENWLYNATAGAVGTKEMSGSFVRSANGTVSVETLTFDTADSVLIDTTDATRGLLTKDYSVAVDDGTASGTTMTYYLIAAGGTGTSGSVVELSSATTDDEVEGMISAVEAMLMDITDAAATLGAINMRVEMQADFVADLMDVIDTGVGRLVDADMNEESTRLKALQTQQQLGIQALSIANTNSENVLSLFK
ncbi:MAG: flagellin [Alphaproteobacteria bacterium]|nr:flagellin [Rhizobiaceae bacterium]MBC7148814.1 flagellin [Rhizobium sp.]MBU3961874.1 flagellin [Alphaproteobacteria bacterium]MBU4050498.1 flagellin [Alphaproteobacteria bacterium]MBU4158327.1 flagellin [Alphaproteobacteria bacterium]